MKRTIVVTDCGHQFTTGYQAARMSGCTMDCKVCLELLIFPEETTVGTCVRGRAFHRYMNEKWSLWPADGRGTYSAGFGDRIQEIHDEVETAITDEKLEQGLAQVVAAVGERR